MSLESVIGVWYGNLSMQFKSKFAREKHLI